VAIDPLPGARLACARWPVLDGLVLDGLVLDGLVLDGLVLDGLVLDGLVLDGLVLACSPARLLACSPARWPKVPRHRFRLRKRRKPAIFQRFGPTGGTGVGSGLVSRK